ncbi:MAG: hypothetical protein HY040_12430 [Planctomycetes bacterium]|nr:hypothetical protein [Planctomycetota bacterium]
MSIRWLKIVVLTIAGTVIVFHFVLYPYVFRDSQDKNMEIAETHLPVIRMAVEGDSRFSEVKPYVYTGMDGAIGVGGCVKSEEDMTNLRRLVAETHPPRPVHWSVRVMPDK